MDFDVCDWSVENSSLVLDKQLFAPKEQLTVSNIVKKSHEKKEKIKKKRKLKDDPGPIVKKVKENEFEQVESNLNGKRSPKKERKKERLKQFKRERHENKRNVLPSNTNNNELHGVEDIETNTSHVNKKNKRKKDESMCSEKDHIKKVKKKKLEKSEDRETPSDAIELDKSSDKIKKKKKKHKNLDSESSLLNESEKGFSFNNNKKQKKKDILENSSNMSVDTANQDKNDDQVKKKRKKKKKNSSKKNKYKHLDEARKLLAAKEKGDDNLTVSSQDNSQEKLEITENGTRQDMERKKKKKNKVLKNTVFMTNEMIPSNENGYKNSKVTSQDKHQENLEITENEIKQDIKSKKKKKNKVLKKTANEMISVRNEEEKVPKLTSNKSKEKMKKAPGKLDSDNSPGSTNTSISKQRDDGRKPFDVTKLQRVLDGKKHPDEAGDTPSIKKKGEPASLRDRMLEQLKSARFRFINEQLYTQTGSEAAQLFREDVDAFHCYHEGFQNQVQKWPTNPVDLIIKQIKSGPKTWVIGDFGCGDAKIARTVPNKVHSFDLVKLNEYVTVCNIEKVPLRDGMLDVGVFCLSLMGTNLTQFILEANRVIKNGGQLIIAEVTSRIQKVGKFIKSIENIGFQLVKQDGSNDMFILLNFKKLGRSSKDVLDIKLDPCVYKKR